MSGRKKTCADYPTTERCAICNPRWTRWPYKGWREDAAMVTIGLFLWAVLVALIVWASR